MSGLPMSYGLALGAVLFALGVAGVLMRRNLLFVLMSLEIMLNGAGVTFVAAGTRWGQPDGQVMFLFILAAAAAEVSVGLALLLRFFHQNDTVDSNAMHRTGG